MVCIGSLTTLMVFGSGIAHEDIPTVSVMVSVFLMMVSFITRLITRTIFDRHTHSDGPNSHCMVKNA